MPRKLSITDQLRRLVRDAAKHGVSYNRLSKGAGIDRSQITRLLNQTVSPRLDTAERIAKAAGYDIALVPRKKC